MEPDVKASEVRAIASGEDSAHGLLGVMRREDFMSSVKRAEIDAKNAAVARDDMLLWAERLLPYLNRDSHMTVAAAVQLYLQAQAGEAPSQPGAKR